MGTAFVILAAGQGTRMHSDKPKVLHEIASAPLLIHAMNSARDAGAARIVVITGPEDEAVGNAARAHDPATTCVPQIKRLGTGHAVGQARDALADHQGDVIVLYGDTPFVRPDTLQEMLTARADGAAVVVLGFKTDEPTGYGRLILDADGGLQKIVEEKDATQEERSTKFCNSGVVCAERELLFSLIAEVGNNNAKGEYYLFDIVGLARARGLACATVDCSLEETLGVNSRTDLAAAEAVFQRNARARALASGVTLLAPDTVTLAFDTSLEQDVTIEPNVYFGPGVTVEQGARIRAFSHLEGCRIGHDAQIGPFARLRPGTEIGGTARIGNFVEVKAAQIRTGAKIGHLSYIGDTEVGEKANIGAGTITCNYDGVFKHRTLIGAGAFIGSNTALVAPVRVGDGALVGSGSVITGDVPAGDLAIGRARQVNKPGLGKRLMDRLRALKSKGE